MAVAGEELLEVFLKKKSPGEIRNVGLTLKKSQASLTPTLFWQTDSMTMTDSWSLRRGSRENDSTEDKTSLFPE